MLSRTRLIAGLNWEGKVLFASASLGWISRMTSSLTSRLSCSRSPAAGGAGTGAATGAGTGVLSFSIASSCWRIFSCIWRICSFISSRSRRSCWADASGVRLGLGVSWAKTDVENRHIVPTMSTCVMLRMRSSSAISSTHLPNVTRTTSGTREGAAYGTDRLSARQGKNVEKATGVHPLLEAERTHLISALWDEEDRSTTYVTRYLEEGRRSPWYRCGKINASTIEGGTQ